MVSYNVPARKGFVMNDCVLHLVVLTPEGNTFLYL